MEYLRVGQITRPHGVHGTVRVMPLTDSPERFYALSEAFIEQGGAHRPVAVSHVQVGEDAVTLQLSGVETREEAEKLRFCYLCVDKAHRAALPEERYFIADLLGCAVFATDGRALGKLTDVLQNGAADVYVISGEKTLMAPALKKLVLEIDPEEKRILLDSAVLEEVGLFED